MKGTMSPETHEGFREKHAMVAAWRTQVLGDLLWRFIPYEEAEPIEDVAKAAVAYYENGGKETIASGDPMFESYSDFFVSVETIVSRSSRIRRMLASEGKFIHIVPFKGVRKADTAEEVERALEEESASISGKVDVYNEIAEEAVRHKKANVRRFSVNLLPVGESKNDEQG